jgi:hypothetical protein
VISAGPACAGSQLLGLIIRLVDQRLTHNICFGLHFY